MVTTTISEILWPSERRLARPPERYTTSEWADRFRILDPVHCAQPGPWRTDFAPYMRGILDSYSDPRCEDIRLMGSTQWGKTEGMVNMLLYSVDQQPMPTLFVMPTEDDVVSFGNRRFKTAVEYCERAAERKSQGARDWKNLEMQFDGMVLYLGFATSAAKLASRSIGRLFMDEIDKYPSFTGKEADPISLATERLRWYQDSKRVLSSTPTTTDGYIWPLWCGSDKRWYHVPCPFCGHFQPLAFNRSSVRWPEDVRDPEQIKLDRLAWYVCSKCERDIPDDGNHKRMMLLDGVWCPEGGEVKPDGTVTGVRTDARVRGFHVNALYSPVLSWSDVAAEFLKSKDDLRTYMNFVNSWLGWPWTERAEENTYAHLESRADERHPRGKVPSWARLLTAGVDVQKREMFWSVLAWGLGERCAVIDSGRCEHFEQLDYLLFQRGFPSVDSETEKTEDFRVRLACIDSAYRTDEVYRFAQQRGDVARAIKGNQSLATPFKTTKIQRDFQGRPGGLLLWHVDTTFFKDKITRCLHTDREAAGALSVHANPHDEWLRQMTSEHKVLVRNARSKQVREEWTVKPGGGGNHWWDTTVYAYAAAEMMGVYMLREDPAEKAELPAEIQEEIREARRFVRKVRSGWLRDRR